MTPRCLCSGILFSDIACWPIDHVPAEGELVQTEKIELCLGGCASNVALDLARLDVPVHLAGCVGDDGLSDFIVKAVEHPLVDRTYLRRASNSCPGTAMHINVQGQDRRFICTTGANDLYTFDDALEKLVFGGTTDNKETKILYLGGFLMLASLENEKTPEFLKRARDHGWTTIVDVVLYGTRNYWDAVRPLLPFVDIFMPNNIEGESLSQLKDALDQAKFFTDAGAKTSVITQGELGTLYYSESDKFWTDIFKLDFVSGSGAGDAFAAGFIAAMLENRSPQECVLWGSALGASCVRGVSTTESIFSREELDRFLSENQLEVRALPKR